jgi:hypothetical protein
MVSIHLPFSIYEGVKLTMLISPNKKWIMDEWFFVTRTCEGD